MNKTFSISEALSFGWNTFKNNWKFWLIVLFITMGSALNNGYNSANKDVNKVNSQSSATANLNSNMLMNSGSETQLLENYVQQTLGASDSRPTINPVILIVGGIYGFGAALGFLFLAAVSIGVSLILRMGRIHVELDAARGKEVFYKTLLSDVSFKKAWKFVAVSALYSLMVVVGLIFLVIPGIYLGLKYILSIYFVVDKDASIGEAFSMSGKATKGNKFRLFGFGIASFFVILLGALVFLVGIVPASITVSLATAYIYVKLSDGMMGTASTDAPAPMAESVMPPSVDSPMPPVQPAANMA